MEIRNLRPGEREALLDLLDGWELPDGWRGRDFFRRYVEDDPTYADENVWVAEDDGRLVSCVQIFPRRLRVGDATIPTGGIGTVYTRPESRETRIASRLLERAADDMRARGMPLSILFASRLGFYGRLGWASWPGTRTLLRRAAEGASPDPDVPLRPFDRARDLERVVHLHALYSATRNGTVVRDAAVWEAVLRNGGNPREDFFVAEREGRVVAYARAMVMSGFLIVSEIGRTADAEREAAALLIHLLAPRAADPLALPARPTEALRALGVAPPLLDGALEASFERAGGAISHHPDENTCLRVLDAEGLAKAAGVALGAGEDGPALLRRLLPPERFSWWSADRF